MEVGLGGVWLTNFKGKSLKALSAMSLEAARVNLPSPAVPWVWPWNLSSCQGPEQSHEFTKNWTGETWVYKSSGGPWMAECEYANELKIKIRRDSQTCQN